MFLKQLTFDLKFQIVVEKSFSIPLTNYNIFKITISNLRLFFLFLEFSFWSDISWKDYIISLTMQVSKSLVVTMCLRNFFTPSILLVHIIRALSTIV